MFPDLQSAWPSADINEVLSCNSRCTHWVSVTWFALQWIQLGERVLMDGHSLDEPAWPQAEVSLGDELLRPSEIYANSAKSIPPI